MHGVWSINIRSGITKMVQVPSDDGYFLYTKSNCKWCQRAKETLPECTVVNVDKIIEKNKDDFLAFVDEISYATPRTFPMVFYNGIFVGGCTESLQHLLVMTSQK
jgi:glutaredoxin